jgi:putative flippase GtrA
MKIIKYFFVGGTAALFDISLFSLFTIYLGYPWVPVSIATFIIATLINYYLSINFVFISGDKFPIKQEILLVFLVSAIGIVINVMILWILIETFEFHLFLAKVISTGCVFLWNYLLRYKYIFRN